MKLKNKNVTIFGLEASHNLARSVCQYLNVEQGLVEKKIFADGELLVRPLSSVRNRDIVVIQSTPKNVNNNLMELLIFVDALKRASAHRIYCVCPYFGYARQDRKVLPRQPISAKLIANLLVVAGVERFTSFDLHSGQIQGFFDIPVDDLKGWVEIMQHLKISKDTCIISPDYGAINKTLEICRVLDLNVAILDKRRSKPNVSEVIHVLGSSSIKGKHCIIVDDMIDTGGTIINGAKKIKEYGAKSIKVIATHGIFSKNAEIALNNDVIDQVYISDTIEHRNKNLGSKIKVVSVAPLLGDIINSLTSSASVSAVLQERKKQFKCYDE